MNRLFAALVLFAACQAWSEPSRLEIVTPKKSVTLTLKELKAKLPLHTVSIDDPIYKKHKVFDGFLLSDVFRLAGFQPEESADEIVFQAKDDYSPNMSFDVLKKHKAYLVFKEHGKNGFEPVAQGKAMLSPAPFYVVWEEGASLEGKVPWPYQLVKIETVRFAEKYSRLYPKDVPADSVERKGFAIFKAQCIRCHSVNLQGGGVGPELNAPRSVTEYWKAEVLPRFIRDAPSFRYKSKMPSFGYLSEQDVDHVIRYLRYMSHHKIASETSTKASD